MRPLHYVQAFLEWEKAATKDVQSAIISLEGQMDKSELYTARAAIDGRMRAIDRLLSDLATLTDDMLEQKARKLETGR